MSRKTRPASVLGLVRPTGRGPGEEPGLQEVSSAARLDLAFLVLVEFDVLGVVCVRGILGPRVDRGDDGG